LDEPVVFEPFCELVAVDELQSDLYARVAVVALEK